MYLIIFLVAFAFLTVVVGIYFLWLAVFSIPYWPSSNKFIKNAVEILKMERIKNIAELGAGDGRMAFALSDQGFFVDAYEINPLWTVFIRFSKTIFFKKNLQVFQKNFQDKNIDYSKYQAVTIYLCPKVMKEMEERLFKEMLEGSIIISNTFKFPNKKAEKICDKMLVYRVKRKQI